MQRPVHRADQQRQRADPGAVRHQHAHAAAVHVEAGQLLADEAGHLGVGEDAVGTADPGGLLCRGHPPIVAPIERRAHTYDIRCDSSFDSTLGSSTSIM